MSLAAARMQSKSKSVKPKTCVPKSCSKSRPSKKLKVGTLVITDKEKMRIKKAKHEQKIESKPKQEVVKPGKTRIEEAKGPEKRQTQQWETLMGCYMGICNYFASPYLNT